MPSLTEVTYYTRKALLYTVYFLVGYIGLRFVLLTSISIYKRLNPPPPPAPTVGFGALPKLKFPENPGYSYDFELQTPTGKFDVFTDRTSVYYMPSQRASLLALDQATQLATKLQFISQPKDLSSGIYEWTRNIPSPLTLKINSISGAFTMTYQWQTDPTILTEKRLQGKEGTISLAHQFISNVNPSLTDIDFTNGTITYLKASGTKTVPAMSLSEADFAKVDFFRKDIDDFKVLTPNPEEGIISLIFSGSGSASKQIVSAIYNYFPINYLAPETYPLKSVTTAWEELISGGGYVANISNNPQKVVIRRVSLAYYDSPQAQQFLQPIFVFSGDDDFVGYVPAISSAFIEQGQ